MKLGGPQAAKVLPVLPQLTAVPTFWPEPVPPTEFCPWKLQKFYLILLSTFDYFLAQNCIRKLYFMLMLLCSNFAAGGIFGLSGQYFQVPPIWLRPDASPPPCDSVPDGDRKLSPKASYPHQEFCEKLCRLHAHCQPASRIMVRSDFYIRPKKKKKCYIGVIRLTLKLGPTLHFFF